MFYSANDFRNPGYAVGYATSNNPAGPWTKYAGNPILNKQLVEQNGTGHGDFFINRKELLYVFHTHNSEKKVAPRKTALLRAGFVKKRNTEKLVMDKKSFYFLRKSNK